MPNVESISKINSFLSFNERQELGISETLIRSINILNFVILKTEQEALQLSNSSLSFEEKKRLLVVVNPNLSSDTRNIKNKLDQADFGAVKPD